MNNFNNKIINDNKIIIKKINNLDINLQTHIYNYFWSTYFTNHVIKELNNIRHDFKLINIYISKHAIPNLSVNLESHYYYYRTYNLKIKDSLKNRSYFLYLNNELKDVLYFYNLLINSPNIIKIKEKYRYFCAYLLSLVATPMYDEYNHFKIISYFKNLD